VLGKGKFGYMFRRSIQLQFGALGVLLIYPLVKRSQAKRLAAIKNRSAAELVQLDPMNRSWPRHRSWTRNSRSHS